jgi:hypothetical protein
MNDEELEELDAKLHRAIEQLEQCPRLIIDLGLSSEDNLRRIFNAMWEIFGLQRQIYEIRPDLTPESLKEPCLDDFSP